MPLVDMAKCLADPTELDGNESIEIHMHRVELFRLRNALIIPILVLGLGPSGAVLLPRRPEAGRGDDRQDARLRSST